MTPSCGISAILLSNRYPESFKYQYLDYLAGLKRSGVAFSIGSDCHDAHYDIDFDTAAEMLNSVGITAKDLWCLPPRNDSFNR